MGRKRNPGMFAAGDTASARVGGLALQERHRQERRLAARAADYEAALRSVLEMIAATGDEPFDRLLKIGAYVREVLKRGGET